MATIDDRAEGKAAALAAAECFRLALLALNATDLGDGRELTDRLSFQAPGTPYQLATDGLLATLDVLCGHGRAYSVAVLDVVMNSGESVAYAMAYMASERDAEENPTCDYCDRPATVVDSEASEALCATDARDMYSDDWRTLNHRPMTRAGLVTIGRLDS